MQAILLAYAGMPMPGLNPDVHILTGGLNKQELAAYMNRVYDVFLEDDAEAKNKWVLYAVSIHGGMEIVLKLKHQIDEWAEKSRGVMAAEAVKALALNENPLALMIVDGMAHKYKYKQVRKAAQDAMGFAAVQLGLTVEDLSDRIVPNHGFDRNMERRFDYGTRSFVVRLLPNLKFEIRDDTGKKIKSLPTVGKNDDIDKASSAIAEFKKLKKQMKITVKNQTERLDLAMYTDRRWNVENWKRLFVNNPIMHPFAISLIWGHYKDGNLTEMFRYMEDGTFNTMNEDEYELTEDGMIGLMHPLEMNQETIDVWREQLSDYGITQVVEQLYRPVYVVEDCEKGQNKIERFGGKIVNGLSLAGKLTSLGWKRGTPYDGGFYYCYDRSDVEIGYAVELRCSGTNIVLEDTDVTVYDAVIYQLDDNFFEGCAESYFYDREAILDEVSPKYFSEIISQITKATASSIKTDENWRENV